MLSLFRNPIQPPFFCTSLFLSQMYFPLLPPLSLSCVLSFHPALSTILPMLQPPSFLRRRLPPPSIKMRASTSRSNGASQPHCLYGGATTGRLRVRLNNLLRSRSPRRLSYSTSTPKEGFVRIVLLLAFLKKKNCIMRYITLRYLW